MGSKKPETASVIQAEQSCSCYVKLLFINTHNECQFIIQLLITSDHNIWDRHQL